MKAAVAPGYDKNRQILADIVPLEAPFTLAVAATQTCNFRCFYCTQSKSAEEKARIGFRQVPMEAALFDRLVEQAGEFEGKIKRVVFTGLGEPLANPQIPEMIRKLSEAGVADGYEIITNAYLLSHEMTDRLLEAGLTYLRVSIQGLGASKYKQVTGTDIDFDRLVEQLSYFYRKKKDCRLYIKIMDACLDEVETEERFFQMFGEICDHLYIEHLIKAQPSMLNDYGDEVDKEVTFYGDLSESRRVCPFLFYVLQVDAEGRVFPCPPLGLPREFMLGDIHEASLKELWNSAKHRKLYRVHLEGKKEVLPVCGACECYRAFTPPEDALDQDAERILERMERGGYV